MGSLRVAAIQYDIVWRDVATNLAKVGPMIDSAVLAGAELVLLPEVFATGFGADLADHAEAPGGPVSTFLSERARTHGVSVGGSVAVAAEPGARPFNRFVLAGPDGDTVHYDKRHLFTYAGEHERMAAGDALMTVPVGGLRVTPFVCYDLRFADDFWSLGPLTDLFVVVANWPAERAAHFRSLLVARAIENQAYVVGVNRIGDAHGLAHGGGSVIIDPWGEIVADAGDAESMIVADLDGAVVESARSSFPTFADRR